MPYFERKPLVELRDDVAGRLQALGAEGSSRDGSSLVQQAAVILSEGSQSAPRWTPPITLSAFSWPGTGNIPAVLQAPAVAVGQTARISISIINDSSEDVPYSFSFTDLISVAGERIPSEAVRATPNTAVVPSGGALDAALEILIPNVSAGQYFGITTCREAMPAILTVTVSA